ncbi:MAG: hypothetical protein R3D33_14845 [Hyphomicrobiaceae bacterium]
MRLERRGFADWGAVSGDSREERELRLADRLVRQASQPRASMATGAAS